MFNEMASKIAESAEKIKETAGKAKENIKNIDIDKKIDKKYNLDKMDNKSIDKDVDYKNIDIDKKIDKFGSEKVEKNTSEGGRYADLKNSKKYDNNKHEIHHMPANSINELAENDGPAIIMDKKDHWQTASWGPSNYAKEYRLKQQECIKKGQLDKAIEMDIKDIQSKFGHKYDKAILEMKEYVYQLKKEGKI